MASFPGSKVHRVSRRQLGRGQSPSRPGATFVMTSASDTATLTFDVPVVVQGPVLLDVEGPLAIVSQTQTSPTVLEIVLESAVAGLDWSLPAGQPIATFQGGGVAAASGTF